MEKVVKLIFPIALVLAFSITAFADVKVRQKTTMSAQTFGTTKMIKGARQRTENKVVGGVAAMEAVREVIDEGLNKILPEFEN